VVVTGGGGAALEVVCDRFEWVVTPAVAAIAIAAAASTAPGSA
jgi:hypothetical protein